jgi:[acyl-carrier-protein] S-malonyltransferase
MGKSLHGRRPRPRAVYDEACQVLGWDLAKVSFEGPDSELTETRVCQPALFVHGMALVAALREQGKLPAHRVRPRPEPRRGDGLRGRRCL